MAINKILLVGNPNVGKSMVFSRLTGVHVETSNYPGTTVELTKGYLDIGDERVEVIDLPGVYSIETNSPTEEVCAEMLRRHAREGSVVINVVDSTNLERNLYLTFQLIESGFPVIVALNMCDDMKHRGVSIDADKLSAMLGVPAIFTCALTGQGIKELLSRVASIGVRAPVVRTHEQRWKEIGRVIGAVQKLAHRHHTPGEWLEDASLQPFPGFVMAALVMYVSFFVVRFIAEGLISRVFDPIVERFYHPLMMKLSSLLGGGGFIHHVLIGDLIGGTVDFRQSMGLLTTAPYIELVMVLPYIISFYLVLSFLEDIGFLPRLALLLDTVFHKIGLHGYAIIPILLGFGCNVPGILATRSLESKKQRLVVSVLISIGVPCVTLQAMIVALLGKYSWHYVFGVYAVLFAIWVFLGLALNRLVPGDQSELLLEIPPFRVPSWEVMFRKVWMRIYGFLVEAFPFVLLGVLILNLLVYWNWLEAVSSFFAPVVSGLFGLPKEAVVALAIGFLRKDVAAGLLMPLGLSVEQMFISVVLLAISFPCVATFVVLLKELGAKALLTAVTIMAGISIVVGTLLHWGIAR
jgi:ferrous iron transport protein B